MRPLPLTCPSGPFDEFLNLASFLRFKQFPSGGSVFWSLKEYPNVLILSKNGIWVEPLVGWWAMTSQVFG